MQNKACHQMEEEKRDLVASEDFIIDRGAGSQDDRGCSQISFDSVAMTILIVVLVHTISAIGLST